ncbi:MAG: aldehyde ferredoxin oxidoreductase C-terminal domain-containing protein, partial [Candidatus Bathyarchaeia archaeon]
KDVPSMDGRSFNNALPLCNDCNWFGTPERGRQVHYEADGLQVKGWPGWDTRPAVELSKLSEDLGLCTWMLQTLAPWIIKVYDSGIKELAGHRLEPYSAEWWRELMHLIARREGLGDILAEDLRRAADRLGLEKEIAAFQMFAWGAPAHRDSRQNDYHPDPGYIVTGLQWALATRDPFNSEHSYSLLQSYIDNYNAGKEPRMRAVSRKTYGVERAFDRGVYADKAEPVVFSGNRSCVKDSLLVCDWVFPRILGVFKSKEEFEKAVDISGDTGIESKLLSAATGIETSEVELNLTGERIYNLERAILMRFGRCREIDETVIPHFKHPDRHDGTRLREAEFKKLMDELYNLRGWDPETGYPTKEKLSELGLRDVADQLEREGFQLI